MPAIAVGQLPLGFALFTCGAELAPGELMLRHALLGEFFGPRAKWKSGSDVSNRAALRAGDAIHIRAAPTELIVPVGRGSRAGSTSHGCPRESLPRGRR